MHNEKEDCTCVACYGRKRVQFAEGSEVLIKGDRVVSFIDIAIVLVDGEPKAAVGLHQGVEPMYIMVGLGGLNQILIDMAASKFYPEVPIGEQN